MCNDLVEISKIMSHPRRLKIMNVLTSGDRLSAKEISSKLGPKILPQYLYDDLNMMRHAEMVSREFDDDKGCFLFSLRGNKLIVDLDSLEIKWCNDV